MRIVILEIGEADPLEIIARGAGTLFFGELAQLEAEFDIGQNRAPRQEGEGLKNHGAVRPRGGHLLSVDRNLAAVAGDQPVDDLQQRGFAAAARADDTDELIGTY